MIDELKALLVEHEGRRAMPYKDTEGLITIGIGRCLDRVGISDDEIEYLFENDVQRVLRDCETFSFWADLDDSRRVVIASMVFQMGLSGVRKFRKMCSAMEAKDYQTAADEMLDSRWAKQTARRARDLSNRMRAG